MKRQRIGDKLAIGGGDRGPVSTTPSPVWSRLCKGTKYCWWRRAGAADEDNDQFGVDKRPVACNE